MLFCSSLCFNPAVNSTTITGMKHKFIQPEDWSIVRLRSEKYQSHTNLNEGQISFLWFRRNQPKLKPHIRLKKRQRKQRTNCCLIVNISHNVSTSEVVCCMIIRYIFAAVNGEIEIEIERSFINMFIYSVLVLILSQVGVFEVAWLRI